MKKKFYYKLETGGEDRTITIRPVKQLITGGHKGATGVFSLSEGALDMGDIVFDDNMKQWEYTSMGNLTHEEANRIAIFIQNYTEN